jgi:membrane peptidoglycan carboxypeptidase
MRRAFRIAGRATLVLLLVLALGVAAIAGRVVWYYGYEIGIPDHHRVVSAASVSVCSDGNRIFVPLANIPLVLRNAVLAAEDPSFYARPPYNPFAEIAKAVLFDDRTGGGSWISTALARCLAHQNPQCCRNIDWHVVSAIVMYRLERDFPKDAIFEAYLNEVWMGRGSYGAAAAADAYFGKPLADLALGEAAFIAAILRTPTRTSRDIERATVRRNTILDRMTKTGSISPEQAEAAKQLQLRIREVPAPI